MTEKPTSMNEFLSKQLLDNVHNLTIAQVVEQHRAIARRSQGKKAEAINRFADVLEQYGQLPEDQRDYRDAVLTILEAFNEALTSEDK